MRQTTQMLVPPSSFASLIRWMEESEGALPGLFIGAESWRPVLLRLRRGGAGSSAEPTRARSARPDCGRAEIPHRPLCRPAAFDRPDFGAGSRGGDFTA